MEHGASYLQLSEQELAERVRRAYDLMRPSCRLCPRECGAERLEGEAGACGADHRLLISSSNLHHGEEPPISGWRGSGTLFLTHCSLSCLYCQNYPISQLGHGVETEVEELAGMMIRLQELGAHNINWVTPTHEAAHLLDGLHRARRSGLEIPIVYNSSGYDSLDVLKLLNGVVDIYLPDMRYADGGISMKYSGVPDYPEVNRKAILEMHRQAGDLRLNSDGIAVRGLLIRHLVLPLDMAGTEKVLRFISKKVSPETSISLMSQYFPAHKAPDMEDVISRRITPEEYDRAKALLKQYGLTRGWIQEI
ncbi:MAG: radical SAM protein [Nitrospirae bacterium CG_4_9_14_3_um_filter_53_35]|nr:MAG: radical SAM protein [Nitrospirae bacterium CG2_30_53_67]PIS35942.1 MAG: radical SAM protein [Nitrospirae bacterium CG08_land_8_20_14_0_20_52_24]PIV84777.1 MAG: radical SAM protein [Nitrospirae bacterium CG17_big_fil_post_rev_8_21_14_2_50_50_9]PIW85101.1 MAG: radical SAM protein [Nitrospirae bacterium CG_4_8_14_3_um_filter_50_41]PIX84573.1 MAG: radical SAM protein [Nitrospirae bacterium CG_4_10_14_3_um_filter_53_41]PJA72810.1 MAG: radical SAM protein [Nitrospirae bacterium CG_4_9_14_3_u